MAEEANENNDLKSTTQIMRSNEEINANNTDSNPETDANKMFKQQEEQNTNLDKKTESVHNKLDKENNIFNLQLVNENNINTNKEEEKGEKRNSRRMSNYLQNIQMTNSTLGLTLNGSEKKDPTLLSDSKTVVRFSPLWKQSLTSSVPILLTIVTGLTSGYSAILLPQLKNDPGPIPSDEDTASWIAAIAALPMAPGCLIAGWLMERFGRKTSQYITCVPLILGWICIASAYNLSLMLIGRFLTGLCAGLFGPLIPVYIGETTEPRYRGFFLAGVSLAISLGILIAHILGTFLTWKWTAIVCFVLSVASTALLTLIPESPIWLISRGRVDEGVKAYFWLRGYSEEAKLELKGIIDSKKAADKAPKLNLKEKLINLKNPELMKPVIIMILFFMTCQFSGVNAVAFYSVEIVEKAVGKGIDHYLAMLIIDALRVVMSLVACVICKLYGRRPLCFISGIWTATSMVGLSMFLYWKPENMSWLPLMFLMFYICAISIGLVPLPWIMCGEVFPTKVRGLGSGLSSAVTFVSFFIVVKTAPGMMSNFGEVITFLSYGMVACVGTVVMYFILPETKGKSLQEIEDRFKYGKGRPGPKV